MPTPKGLPKVGEVWQRTAPDGSTVTARVLERGHGDYWSLRVEVIDFDGKPPAPRHRLQTWVDSAYWFSQGQLKCLPGSTNGKTTIIDYDAIATTVASVAQEWHNDPSNNEVAPEEVAVGDVAEALKELFRRADPTFDADRFMAACNVPLAKLNERGNWERCE